MYENKHKQIAKQHGGRLIGGSAVATHAPPNSSLQGGGLAAQMLSRRMAISNISLLNAAPAPSGISTALKTRFEKHTGVSLEGVRVHIGSPKPEALGALAYAQGNDIYLGPGQEKQLSHELGHVVQQRLGRVRPTGQVGGVSVNRDPSLEAGADTILSQPQAGSLPQTALSGPPVAQLKPDLSNVVPMAREYTSMPRPGMDRVYRMVVDVENDPSLQEHIEMAQAFASPFQPDDPKRIAALMKYVTTLNRDEDKRNAVYRQTQSEEELGEGQPIYTATLGECLDSASACRELSAFMQILLAQEGILTHMTVGNYGRNNPGRHAWLTTKKGAIIDPTRGVIYADPSGAVDYEPDESFTADNFASPRSKRKYVMNNVDDELRWKDNRPWDLHTTGFWLFKRTIMGESYQKAMEALQQNETWQSRNPPRCCCCCNPFVCLS